MKDKVDFVRRVITKLNSPTSINALVVFRVLIGLIFIYLGYYFNKVQLVEQGLFAPHLLFKFYMFEFVELLPKTVMIFLVNSFYLSGFLIVIGAFTRIAALYSFLILMYLLFLEKSLFNNHLYLYALLALLLSFTSSDGKYSVQSFLKEPREFVPFWNYLILRLMFFIMYFYGGIAKLNYDWLVRQEPFRSLYFRANLNEFFYQEWIINFMNYSGLIFDLGIGFLLLFKRTRLWSIPLLMFFHLTNTQIFDDIGSFPYAALFASVIFFDALWDRNVLIETEVKPPLKPIRVAVKYFLVSFFIFQFLFPLRGFFLPNDVNWSKIGKRFSWNMKSYYSEVESIRLYVMDPSTGQPGIVDYESYLNTLQIRYLSTDAHMIWLFSRFIHKQGNSFSLNDPEVYVESRVNLNNSEYVYYVDNRIDMSKVEFSPFQNLDWLNPRPLTD